MDDLTYTTEPHPRGSLYRIQVEGRDREISVLIVDHTEDAMREAGLVPMVVLQTLLYPEETLPGQPYHPGRYVAHLRTDDQHLVRVIYEYEDDQVVIVTTYPARIKEYFQGGGSFADQVL
ncbi:MAG: DUF4258 domain-containing protein [Candidatus Bipolaricaulia bacterium]